MTSGFVLKVILFMTFYASLFLRRPPAEPNPVIKYQFFTRLFSAGYGERGVDFAYEGVGPPKFKEGVAEKTFHAYYQWVPFVLFLQGIMFYFPHYLWKLLEDKKLDKITKDLRGKTTDYNNYE